jgi:hypothetical protein
VFESKNTGLLRYEENTLHPREIATSGDPKIDGRIILKLMFEELGVKV